MKKMIATLAPTLITSLLWVGEAAAACPGGLPVCDDGGATFSPEINGPAGMAAIALVASIGALLYSRAKK